MCYCDIEQPSFVQVSLIKKSKKQHVCCECQNIIPIGSRYLKTSGLWDGSFGTFKQCDYCTDLISRVEKIDNCACLTYGGLYSYFDDQEDVKILTLGLEFFSRCNFGNRDNWVKEMRSRLKSEII
jgi:hypothetical protein